MPGVPERIRRGADEGERMNDENIRFYEKRVALWKRNCGLLTWLVLIQCVALTVLALSK